MRDTDATSQKVLEAIRRSLRLKGRPPTLREICADTGIKSTNGARYHLAILERAGVIERDPLVTRGLRIVQDAPDSVAGRTGSADD